MKLVVDASVVVAAFTHLGAHGTWADAALRAGSLVAPHSMPYEVTSALRRLAQSGALEPSDAQAALEELTELRVTLHPFEPFADRIWELRKNLTAFDAAYVALAEQLGAPLATLDGKLAQATGPRCSFRTP